MALSRLQAWVGRRLAGPEDAGSLLADLDIEASERTASHGRVRARLWLWSEIARSAPSLLRRRLTRPAAAVRKGPDMFLRGVWLDLQHVLRRLRRSPGFAAIAVALLAIGIGATTSVFSLAYAIWLKPLPYRATDELIAIAGSQRRTGFHSGSSAAELADIRANLPSASGVAGYHYAAIFAHLDGEPFRLLSYVTTANLFTVLGVQAQIGRTFTPDDAGQSVIVLSDDVWRTRFHADPRVLGRVIGGADEQMTVIGVMPRGFRFPLILEADGWTPTLRDSDDRQARLTYIVARLKPGATIDRADAELAALSARLATAYPASNADWVIAATPLDGGATPATRAAFTTLLTMVGFFLVIACANLASLFVSRNLARRAELTLALAIGASPARVARTLVMESAVISLAGALVGLALASQAMTIFARWLPPGTPRLGDLRVTGVVLAFAVAVSLVTTLLCAIAPIAGVRKLRIAETLGGTRTTSAASQRGQHALVVVEVALAALLLIGGGAMSRSFNELLGRDRGYMPTGVVTMTVSLPFDNARYERAPIRAQAFDELLAGIAGVPGVTSVGAATGFPGSSLGILGAGPVTVPGRTDPPVVASLHNATPDYFRAMGVALKRGRMFSSDDRGDRPRVVVINEALERQLWPDGRSLGQRFRIPTAIGLGDRSQREAEVIGVIGDLHMGARHNPEIFVPFAQAPSFWADVVVRTSGDTAAMNGPVRQAIRRANPDVLIEHESPMQTIIANTYGLERAQSFLTMLVAMMGAMIALTGIYALLAQHVARRTREMGIRLALGSSPRRLFWTVFGRGLRLAAAGVGAGVGVSLPAMRLLRGQVFGLDALSVWLIVPIAIAIVTVAAFVVATCARRVIRIDPLISIRQP